MSFVILGIFGATSLHRLYQTIIVLRNWSLHASAYAVVAAAGRPLIEKGGKSLLHGEQLSRALSPPYRRP
jgi:hypothetical protein